MDPLKMYFLFKNDDIPASYVSLPEGKVDKVSSMFLGRETSSIHPGISYLFSSSNSILSLEVERLFIEWFFGKDHYFSRDLQSTIPGDYFFNGLWLTGLSKIAIDFNPKSFQVKHEYLWLRYLEDHPIY